MKQIDPYDLVHQLSLIQEKAGVDRDVRELYVAYAKLRLNAGRALPDFGSMECVEQAAFCDRYIPGHSKIRDADPRFKAFVTAYSKAMIGQRLPVILSVSHFARKLGVSTRQLRWLSRNHDHLYHRFTIPKPSGGKRVIHAPVDSLKTLQGWLHRHVLVKARVHKCATGFRRGVSIVDNAMRHTGRAVVVRIDLKDFFPTVTYRQVRHAFEQLGYPYAVAMVMANLCTLGGVLPQGAPTSPSLANLVCRNMDERLYRLSLKWRCRYSRYADDLVFSSRKEQMPSLIPFIKSVVGSEGFVVNENKVRIMRRGVQQKVTGLVVNAKPNLSRIQRRTLRAMAHRLSNNGAEALRIRSFVNPDAEPINVFTGRMAFLGMVNPDTAATIARVMNRDKRELEA